MNCKCNFSPKTERKKRSSGRDGRSTHPLYAIWRDILYRCGTRGGAHKKYYEMKKIYVCDQWKEDFLNFKEDIGSRPSLSHSVDRVDNSKGYCPHNTRWATPKEQARNRTAAKQLPNSRISVTGVRGCTLRRKISYSCYIRSKGSNIYLGAAYSLAEAIDVRLKFLKSAGVSEEISYDLDTIKKYSLSEYKRVIKYLKTGVL